MSNIKFRAWHKKELEMYKWGSGIISIDHHMNAHTIPYPKLILNENLVWMQFTGLQDVNGKDIYEGDIVDVGKVMQRHCVIEYKNAKFLLKFQDDFETGSPTDIDIFLERIRIIGNIYENPELVMSN